MSPSQIESWASEVRSHTNGGFNINLWIPDPPPKRDAAQESRVRDFLGQWGPEVKPDAGETVLQDFDAQCEALLRIGPSIVSSIMGVFPPAFVAKMKNRGISWFANATTLSEAREAEAAGADVIVAQGSEAGGHRGAFDAAKGEKQLVGLFSLLPAIADAVKVPVVATGGIADARGVAAALTLGASAVQVGTGYLRTPEAKTHPAWADALATTAPEDTTVTRAHSGRPGRSIANDFVRAWTAADAPAPAPYPVQRGLMMALRADAMKAGDINRMTAWAGQSAALASAEPAGALTQRLWDEARALIT
jgi:nitronate monooxygenase